MTLTELLSMPKGITVEEYERLLKQKENLYRRISGLTEKILTEEDSIFVLSDEVGSDRYNKHVEAKKKFELLLNDCYAIVNEYESKIFKTILDKLRDRILGV